MDNIQGTVIGDNKYIIIPMENKETVELDQEIYYEYHKLFNNINAVEEAINILVGSSNGINGEKLAKAITNLISVNDDNIETIFNFLLYLASEERNNQSIKFNELYTKHGNKFYSKGINDAKKICKVDEKEDHPTNIYENEEKDLLTKSMTTYNDIEEPKIMFTDDNNDKETPLFEIVPYGEAEEI